jgi:hypothetical protein
MAKVEVIDSGVKAVAVLGSIVGLVSGISGLASSSWIVPLNILGYCSVLCVPLGLSVGTRTANKEFDRGVRNGALASSIGAIVMLIIYFTVARPLQGDERAFNILTIFGMLSIIAVCVVLPITGAYYKRLNAPAMRKCPDCANEVLLEARKCQYCQYRFDDATGQ